MGLCNNKNAVTHFNTRITTVEGRPIVSARSFVFTKIPERQTFIPELQLKTKSLHNSQLITPTV